MKRYTVALDVTDMDETELDQARLVLTEAGRSHGLVDVQIGTRWDFFDQRIGGYRVMWAIGRLPRPAASGPPSETGD